MAETTTLKVWICPCTQLFRGQLAGRKFQAGSREFVLEEVDKILKDGIREQRRALIDEGCQIFLDVHYCYVFLDLHMVVPVGNEYLLVNWPGSKVIRWEPTKENPPTTDQVVDTLRTQIEESREEAVESWLSSWTKMAEQLALTASS